MKNEIACRLVSLTLVLGVMANSAAAQAAAIDGARLYRRHCASCHGSSGRGDGRDASQFAPPPRDLRTGFLQRYPAEDLVRRVLSGEPLALVLDPPALRARSSEIEALAAHLERLPAVDWRLAERGQELYVDRCEICHGPAGRPGTTLPPGVASPRDLSDPGFQRALRDADLRIVVRHGRAGMPTLVPRVPDEDVPALVAFVRLLSPGFELYGRYCSACHGDDGRGSGSFAEALPRPTVVFDRAYFARRDPEAMRAKIWHMLSEHKPSMPHFRDRLSEPEARAIIMHLKRTD